MVNKKGCCILYLGVVGACCAGEEPQASMNVVDTNALERVLNVKSSIYFIVPNFVNEVL